VALGVGLEQKASPADRHLLADAGEHILERAAVRRVVEQVLDRDDRGARLPAERVEVGQPGTVVGAVSASGGEVDGDRPSGDRAQDLGETDRQPLGRDRGEDHPLRASLDVGQRQRAAALGHAQLALRQETAEPAVGSPVGGVGQQARAVGEVEAAADDEARAPACSNTCLAASQARTTPASVLRSVTASAS
jgi:hypothetical protein